MHTAAARAVKLSMWSHSTVSTGRVELRVRLSQFHPIPLQSKDFATQQGLCMHCLWSTAFVYEVWKARKSTEYPSKETNINQQKKLAYKHVLIGSLKPYTQATLHHCQAPEPTPGLRRGSLGHANMSIFFELAPLLTGPGTNPLWPNYGKISQESSAPQWC